MPKPAEDNVRFIANGDPIFPPKGRPKVGANFRVHDLRDTFASWYIMSGGDLYELAKILGHSNIKLTERYAKLGRQHIARTTSTSRQMWNLLEPTCDKANAA